MPVVTRSKSKLLNNSYISHGKNCIVKNDTQASVSNTTTKELYKNIKSSNVNEQTFIKITSYDDLTDEFILEVSDKLFQNTLGYNAFKSKKIFVNKIKDKHLRYNFLKNILN